MLARLGNDVDCRVTGLGDDFVMNVSILGYDVGKNVAGLAWVYQY